MAKPWFSIAKAGNNTGSISIFSEIGGVAGLTASDFGNQLRALGSPTRLLINISSPGGDVTEGFAIYNMLARHPARKVVNIDGLAASMGSVIAMVGDEITMPKNSMLMIHNPWGGISGGPEQIISFGEAIMKMRDNIAQVYVDRTGLDTARILDMMEKETWMTAREAVDLGFADRVTDPIKAVAKFDLSKFKKIPKGLFTDSRRSAPDKPHPNLDPIAIYEKWNFK